MIPYTPRALRQIAKLDQHYRRLLRTEAIINLNAALEEAERKISENPAGGLAAPRPYRQLARRGMSWVQAGRYWVGYRTAPHLAIVAVFYDQANIPGRL